MTCSFCGSRNGDDEARCRRCGRKATDTLSQGLTFQAQGNLATVARADVIAAAAPEPAPLTRPMVARPSQRALFPEAQSNIIPFETFSEPRAKPVPRPVPSVKVKAPSRRSESQSELEFLASAAGPRKLSTAVEAVIYCDAPVATRLHRAVAAALDWSLVLIGYGLFLLAYRFGGGEWVMDKTSLATLGAVLPLLGFTYGLFWALAGTETFGMRWAHLRLLNFDGFPPEPKSRVVRLLGSCLSMLTCGLGLIWALADEESLTWQDHMSRTFPTPRADEDRILLRR